VSPADPAARALEVVGAYAMAYGRLDQAIEDAVGQVARWEDSQGTSRLRVADAAIARLAEVRAEVQTQLVAGGNDG
jgi:hypothetical protein